jgi:hypothetical protein
MLEETITSPLQTCLLFNFVEVLLISVLLYIDGLLISLSFNLRYGF